jgi:molybdopterin molybdotransferase
MPEFLELLPPRVALQTLLHHLIHSPHPEQVATDAALGRVLAEPVTAPHPLPEFPRSTVDGFAVRAKDTFGASESLPGFLQVIGEVGMGQAPALHLGVGECTVIHTGGMLPGGADAVVMMEYTQSIRPGEIELVRPAAVGENTLAVGEDVAAGEEVIARGTRLRPQEIGGLMSLGITSILAARRPKVCILSSGDEVIPPWQQSLPGQVRDINSYSLASLVEESGGAPCILGIIPDQPESLYAAASRALQDGEMVMITAGSSASSRDMTASVIDRLGKPGVLVHGVNVRPGKPTILGACSGIPVIGLPGNPVSALVIARLFVQPVIEFLTGVRPRRKGTVSASMAVNVPSQAGREDWIPVRLIEVNGRRTAEPVFGKSNLIFSLVRSDGMVCIPPDATGLESGAAVEVELF